MAHGLAQEGQVPLAPAGELAAPPTLSPSGCPFASPARIRPPSPLRRFSPVKRGSIDVEVRQRVWPGCDVAAPLACMSVPTYLIDVGGHQPCICVGDICCMPALARHELISRHSILQACGLASHLTEAHVTWCLPCLRCVPPSPFCSSTSCSPLPRSGGSTLPLVRGEADSNESTSTAQHLNRPAVGPQRHLYR